MASKDIKNRSGSPSRKGAPESKNWMKTIIPLFLVVTMLLSILAYGFISFFGNSEDTSHKIDRKFDSISSGLKLVPEGSIYARYVDMDSNSSIAAWAAGNINASMPKQSDFGAAVKKDLIVDYPDNYFGNFNQQWVSLTDFGNASLNNDYVKLSMGDQYVYQVREGYYFTSNTHPVVSGRLENVAVIVDVMNGLIARTSYDTYSDLFELMKGYPENDKTAKFAVVGTYPANVNFTDKYYAGVTPVGDKYNYKIALHLSKKYTDEEKQSMKMSWEKIATLNYNFDYYQVRFNGDYAIIDASTSSFDVCIRDMNLWGFLYA